MWHVADEWHYTLSPACASLELSPERMREPALAGATHVLGDIRRESWPTVLKALCSDHLGRARMS